jgi:hypothetical protein
VILTVATALYFVIGVPESPKWFYIQELFEEAKEALQKVGDFNNVSDRRISHLSKI